jgi:hypothetical protein
MHTIAATGNDCNCCDLCVIGGGVEKALRAKMRMKRSVVEDA